MNHTSFATLLPERALLKISGSDRISLLQALLTTHIVQTPELQLKHGALLTPQGKILALCLLYILPDCVMIECTQSHAEILKPKLMLYKLRSDVTIAPDDNYNIYATSTAEPGLLPDPRTKAMGFRGLTHKGEYAFEPENYKIYTQKRLHAAVAESDDDCPPETFFPHDLGLDKNQGVSFTKGCYIGQEVVSRMQHRADTIRKRPVFIQGKNLLQSGEVLFADGRECGRLGTVQDHEGLGIARIDKLKTARDITAGDEEVIFFLPKWIGDEQD